MKGLWREPLHHEKPLQLHPWPPWLCPGVGTAAPEGLSAKSATTQGSWSALQDATPPTEASPEFFPFVPEAWKEPPLKGLKDEPQGLWWKARKTRQGFTHSWLWLITTTRRRCYFSSWEKQLEWHLIFTATTVKQLLWCPNGIICISVCAQCIISSQLARSYINFAQYSIYNKHTLKEIKHCTWFLPVSEGVSN